MPDIPRKFLRIDGVQHTAGCADAIGAPCTCGAELLFALELVREGIEDPIDGAIEDVEIAKPDEEFHVMLEARAIRAVRQALVNQSERRR